MKPIAHFSCLCLLAILPTSLCSQSPRTPLNATNLNAVAPAQASQVSATMQPFSRLAIGGGFSTMGVTLVAATNLNRYLDLSAEGNVFTYTANNISTNNLNVNGKLSMASAGASLNLYPFPNHGLRISPGLLFYNTNGASATLSVPGGTSFTLNNVTYYASSTNPITGTALLDLHHLNPAFTITAGWGSLIPRRGGHWSFPFEVGIALSGAPQLSMALTSGQVCDAQGRNCVSVTSDPSLQSNLQAQSAKYENDLDPLKTFPMVGAGVVYNFAIR